MEVVFLGTGNAFASGGRNAMAILLRGSDLGVLLDCGPTTLVALKKVLLAPADVDVVLLTHHHGDHFAGVPFLLCHERYAGEREKPLRILGPPGTRSLLETTSRLFFPGMEPLSFPLELRDLDPGEEAVLGSLRVRPFEVDHSSRGLSFGYRVEIDDRTVVFSGDTAWTEALVRESAGSDLFVCECSSFERSQGKHVAHHDLAENRHRIGARRTILVHAGEDVIEREEELVFELARDEMRLTI